MESFLRIAVRHLPVKSSPCSSTLQVKSSDNHRLYLAFASPQLNSPRSSACGNEAAIRPLFTWSEGTYPSTYLTAYNNLKTPNTPLLSVLSVDHTTDGNEMLGSFQAHLSYSLLDNVKAGCQTSAAIPGKASGAVRSQGIVGSISHSIVWAAAMFAGLVKHESLK